MPIVIIKQIIHAQKVLSQEGNLSERKVSIEKEGRIREEVRVWK